MGGSVSLSAARLAEGNKVDSATQGVGVGGGAEAGADHLAFSVNRGYNFQMEGGIY